MNACRRILLRSIVPPLLCFVAVAAAQELKPIQLPKPVTEGGKPLMQVLKERKSAREFGAQKLTEQVLSNLLWAAFGINRPDGRRSRRPFAAAQCLWYF